MTASQVFPTVSDWQPWFVVGLLVVMFVLFVTEYRAPSNVAFAGMVILWNAGLITMKDALGGFSNSGLLAVGVLFVVVQGVEKSQIAPTAARYVCGTKTGPRAGLARMTIFIFILSAFLNNTPIVAMFAPIVRDWARTRGFSPSTFLMPLSFACIMGGLVTTIGTSTNLGAPWCCGATALLGESALATSALFGKSAVVVVALATNMGIPAPGFFEVGYIGLPAGIIGIIYLVIFAPVLLPKSGGMFKDMMKKDRLELITEARVTENFSMLGKPVSELLAKLGLPTEIVIKIRRRNFDDDTNSSTPPAAFSADPYLEIYPVLPTEPLLAGDIVFLSGGAETMVKLHSNACAKGLIAVMGDTPELVGTDSELDFVEVVVSNQNKFVGNVLANTTFGMYYGCSLLALRPRGDSSQPLASLSTPSLGSQSRATLALPAFLLDSAANTTVPPVPPAAPPGSYVALSMTDPSLNRPPDEQARGQDSTPPDDSTVKDIQVSERKLKPGDVLLALAPKGFEDKWRDSDDFLMITRMGSPPRAVKMWDYVPLAIFLGMILWCAIADVDMVQAAMAAAAILVMVGWIDSKTAASHVDWDLLLLIGSMLAFSRAMVTSGIANMIGNSIRDSGLSALGALFLMYGVTTAITEIMTNNAAAGLLFPLAVAIAKKLEVSYKPFMFIVMGAASTSFLTPMGYQTNTMVWGPGGYKFYDFTKFGLILNISHMVVSCILAPYIWPFDEKIDWSKIDI